MKDKPGKGVRPRFHIYFEMDGITDEDLYAGLKRGIVRKYPFFDKKALDAARFIYGADTGDVIWHEGWTTIDEDIQSKSDIEEEEDADEWNGGGRTGGVIPQGSRNNTLSLFAGKALKRFGETDKAKRIFMEEAAKCDPPLDKEALKSIWYSAVKFFRNKIKD